MSRTGDLNRRARDRMHAVLSPEFFLMWLIEQWMGLPNTYRQDLRIVLKWAVNRYLDGKLDG